jgi:peptidyl-prolyl cis-trans isomerase-like 2
MGKWTDKDYITHSEWTRDFSGAKSEKQRLDYLKETKFQKLPLDHCALTLRPFENPVCTPDGSVCDLEALLPFVRKHKVDPVTGNTLEIKDIIQLKFQKNAEGHYYCPVTMKTLTDLSHVAAIRVTGNVFSMESIEKLNIKPKNWKDLLTDEPFTRSDIIMLQVMIAISSDSYTMIERMHLLRIPIIQSCAIFLNFII